LGCGAGSAGSDGAIGRGQVEEKVRIGVQGFLELSNSSIPFAKVEVLLALR
jgi:hypothetical protein